jgi:hypothetical protein
LITTAGWPALTAFLAGATARAAADPAILAGSAGALALAGVLLVRGRPRSRPGDRSS